MFDTPLLLQLAPGLLLGLVLLCYLVYIFITDRREKSGGGDEDPSKFLLNIIKARRTITPKDFNGNEVTQEEVKDILEAANWAPTHKKTEPWRYSIFVGSNAILDYLDFIENWYEDHKEDISEKEMEGFRNKVEGIRREWPNKVSHLLVIGMKRHDGLPDWEELCAVAMSVQNMHLMVTASDDLAGFWSSHTWCKRLRDHPDFHRFIGLGEGDGNRILGAFVLGKVDPEKKSAFRSSRGDIATKLTWKT